MSWMNERDALIAQTMAFVEQVAGKMPETRARVEIVLIGAIERVERPVRVEVPLSNRPVSTALPSVREEIQSRIETFRAHQHRFHREREEYFKSVLAKARASTGGGNLPRRS
jgi:hypothetical protein